MVTAGHLACGAVTAMRSLSSALGNRHDREGAASHRPVGGGRRDGHDRRHPGRRRPGHADGDQAPACSSDPAGAGRHRGGHCVRPGGPGGVRHRADRGSRRAPAAEGQDRSPARSRPPGPRGGPPRAWRVTGAWQGRAPGRHPARRRPRPARRRSAFRAAAAAEPDERLFTGRAHRRAQGWPWIPERRMARTSRRSCAPRDPARLMPGRAPGAQAGGRSQDRPSPGRAGPQPSRHGYPPGMNPGGPGRVPYGPSGQPVRSRAAA